MHFDREATYLSSRPNDATTPRRSIHRQLTRHVEASEGELLDLMESRGDLGGDDARGGRGGEIFARGIG
jgi:hypothetical protein